MNTNIGSYLNVSQDGDRAYLFSDGDDSPSPVTVFFEVENSTGQSSFEVEIDLDTVQLVADGDMFVLNDVSLGVYVTEIEFEETLPIDVNWRELIGNGYQDVMDLVEDISSVVYDALIDSRNIWPGIMPDVNEIKAAVGDVFESELYGRGW